jgi:ribosomal-protein-alanine N-acetyltransferase
VLLRYLEVDKAWRDHLLMAITVEEVSGSVTATLVRAGHASWA